MKNIIYNSLILGALLTSTQSKAQHLLEALEGQTVPDGAISKLGEIVYCDDGGIKSEYKRVETNIGWFRIEEWYLSGYGFGGCDYVMEGLNFNDPILAPYKTLLVLNANCSWTGSHTCDAEGLVIGSTGQLGRLEWVKFHK